MDYSLVTNLIEQKLIKVLNKNIYQALSNNPFSSKLGEGFEDLDKELLVWLHSVLGIANLSSNTGNLNENHENTSTADRLVRDFTYIAPSVVLSICDAIGGSQKSDQALTIAASIQIFHAACALFDAIQDQDGSSTIVNDLGFERSNNLALMLLISGQKILTENLIKFFDDQDKLLHTEIPSENGFPTHSSFLLSLQMLNELWDVLMSGFRGQMLDLQEISLPLNFRLGCSQFYLTKLALKTGLIYSYLSSLGAVLGGASNTVIEQYKQFGFAFGIALHLLDDLGDYLKVLHNPSKSRDLQYRYLTLPILYNYESLTADAQNKFLELWQLGKPQLDQSNSFNPELSTLLKSDDGAAFLQSLTLVTQYITQAEFSLKKLDPYFEKQGHTYLMTKLTRLAQELYSRYFNLRTQEKEK